MVRCRLRGHFGSRAEALPAERAKWLEDRRLPADTEAPRGLSWLGIRLDFGAGRDLFTVVESGSVLSVEPAWDSVPSSPSAPPLLLLKKRVQILSLLYYGKEH